MDADRLKRTWQIALDHGDEFSSTFYAHLFVSHPEVREMFPLTMNRQQDRFLHALGQIVSSVSDADRLGEFVGQLGRDHRRFDVAPEHYDAVGASLLWTLKHFLADEWTPETAQDWATAYNAVATTMITAAEKSEDVQPPWWNAEVISADRVSRELLVVKVKLDEAMDYRPGQSFSVSGPHAPRVWRYLTPANAPRDDLSIDLHVAIVPGGQFSSPFVKRTAAGDQLKLGAPLGTELAIDPEDEEDLLMVAGSTGIAPMLAILDDIASAWRSGSTDRRVHLVHGARFAWNLYAGTVLEEFAKDPRFTFTESVSEDSTYPGTLGLVGDVAADTTMRGSYSALVCGSPGMVDHTVRSLRSRADPPRNVQVENYDAIPNADATGE